MDSCISSICVFFHVCHVDQKVCRVGSESSRLHDAAAWRLSACWWGECRAIGCGWSRVLASCRSPTQHRGSRKCPCPERMWSYARRHACGCWSSLNFTCSLPPHLRSCVSALAGLAELLGVCSVQTVLSQISSATFMLLLPVDNTSL